MLNIHNKRKLGFSNKYIIKGEITYIIITNNKGENFNVLIDTKNLKRLKEADLRWNVTYDKCTNEYYVKTIKYLKGGGKEHIVLHRFITNAPQGMVVDHHNHNRLDNREENLFVTEYKNNSTNRKGSNSNNKSGYRNVFWNSSIDKWSVRLSKNYKQINLGDYDDVHEAGRVAEEGRKKYYGEYAGKN